MWRVLFWLFHVLYVTERMHSAQIVCRCTVHSTSYSIQRTVFFTGSFHCCVWAVWILTHDIIRKVVGIEWSTSSRISAEAAEIDGLGANDHFTLIVFLFAVQLKMLFCIVCMGNILMHWYEADDLVLVKCQRTMNDGYGWHYCAELYIHSASCWLQFTNLMKSHFLSHE